MARKIGSIIVMALAVLGALICLIVLIGAWAVRPQLTTGGVAALEAAAGYLDLAERATGLAAQVTADTADRFTGVETALAERREDSRAALDQLKLDIAGRIGPTLRQVYDIVKGTADTIVAFNATLETANRLPGVDLPTLTPQIETVQSRLDAVLLQLEAIRGAVDETLPDGTPVQDALGQVAADLNGVAGSLQEWSGQLGATRTAAQQLQTTLPGMLTWLVVGVSLLMILLGAGQVSLFLHALGWYRTAV